jgi:hypothetical protein
MRTGHCVIAASPSADMSPTGTKAARESRERRPKDAVASMVEHALVRPTLLGPPLTREKLASTSAPRLTKAVEHHAKENARKGEDRRRSHNVARSMCQKELHCALPPSRTVNSPTDRVHNRTSGRTDRQSTPKSRQSFLAHDALLRSAPPRPLLRCAPDPPRSTSKWRWASSGTFTSAIARNHLSPPSGGFSSSLTSS